MIKVLCQDLIEDFFNKELRRSIKVNTFNKLGKNKNKGVAKATPKKEK